MIGHRIFERFVRTAIKAYRIQHYQNQIGFTCLLKSDERRFRIRKPYWTGCFTSSIGKIRRRNKNQNTLTGLFPILPRASANFLGVSFRCLTDWFSALSSSYPSGQWQPSTRILERFSRLVTSISSTNFDSRHWTVCVAPRDSSQLRIVIAYCRILSKALSGFVL